jgi:hypothetical protein
MDQLLGWDDAHREAIRSLATRFDISPRLMGFLCPEAADLSKAGTNSIPKPTGAHNNAPDREDLEKCVFSSPPIPART